MVNPDDQRVVQHLQATRLFWQSYGLSDQNSGVGVCASRLRAALKTIGIAPEELPASSSNRAVPKPLAAGISAFRIGKLLAATPSQSAILHGLSNFNVPMYRIGRGSLRYVLTVHDLIPITHPGFVSKALSLQMKLITPLALAAADAIVCSSKFTEQEVQARYPVSRGKCVFVPLGREKKMAQPSVVTQLSSAGVNVLSVSRDEPYKMLSLAVEILAQAPDNWTMTIVTNPGGQRRLLQHAASLKLDGRLRVLAGLPSQSLEQLYSLCDVYFHPSLVEGYCLPAVEALSHSKPVVYRSGTVLEETVGPCGIGVPSNSKAAQWIDALASASKWGRAPEFQAKLQDFSNSSFSWLDCAYSYARVYDSLVR